MSKRQADNDELRDSSKAATFSSGETSHRTGAEIDEMGEFEDAFEDEIEEDMAEEIVNEQNDEDNDDMEVDEKEEKDLEVYLPGKALGKDEVLEADQSVYEMLHKLNVEWPCLSFDVLQDRLGDERKTYPATAYVVAGTSAPNARDNELIVMKMSQLHKTQNDDESDDEDADGVDDDAILESRSIRHNGGVNRVRVMPQQNEKNIAATWSDTGKVHIYDVTPYITSLDTPGTQPSKFQRPLFTVDSHVGNEGFAMDWSVLDTGRLLTGDIASNIYLTSQTQSGYKADMMPFRGHTSSVEDLQWSPTERNVFASCSADQTVKIWDTRNKKKHAVSIQASSTDVNVITWNKKASYLLASGGDDGIFNVWDLRTFTSSKAPSPVATFKWHNAPITSIEWHPTEESIIGVAGADDQISIWDLSVEPDTEEGGQQITEDGVEIPPQLLFVHQGQAEIKEIHWHKQIPGCMISTAGTGFNIFKTISV